MKQPMISTSLILAIALVPLTGPAPTEAADDPGAPAVSALAPTIQREPVVVDSKGNPERQREIYRILRGGAVSLDATLSSHLWQVAESLAGADWQPPKVTLHVVVSDASIHD